MKQNLMSIVVPAHNEADSIALLYKEICSALASLGRPFELILVDDGSTDGTWHEIVELAAADARVKGIRLRKRQGKSCALRVAFSETSGDPIVMLDADLQDSPKEIGRLINQMNEGYDLVIGWRRPRADAWPKRLASKIYNCALNFLSGLSLHDHNCGLKVLSREVILHLKLYGDLHRFISLLAWHGGFRVGEVKVFHRERLFGASKYGAWRLISAFFDALAVAFLIRFGKYPLRFLGCCGAGFAALGAALLAYLALLWGAGLGIAHRSLFLLALVMLLFGMQAMFLGVIAELIMWTAEGSKLPEYHQMVRERVGHQSIQGETLHNLLIHDERS